MDSIMLREGETVWAIPRCSCHHIQAQRRGDAWEAHYNDRVDGYLWDWVTARRHIQRDTIVHQYEEWIDNSKSYWFVELIDHPRWVGYLVFKDNHGGNHADA